MTDETTPPAGTPPGNAASELFADGRPAPREAPASFLNPRGPVENSTYVGQDGGLRFGGSNEQAQAIYNQAFKDEENLARRTRFKADSTEEDLAHYAPEAVRSRMDKLKAALAADGYAVSEPAPPETQHAADVNMIHLGARPSHYSVSLPPNADPGTHGELTSMAAELEFTVGVGNGLLDRLVKLGPERIAARKDAATWEAFAAKQRAALLQRAGGEEALNSDIEAVRAMLLSVTGNGRNIAHAIAENAGTLDKYVFSMLRTQARGRAQFYKSRARH
jgi:hypothetical protein